MDRNMALEDKLLELSSAVENAYTNRNSAILEARDMGYSQRAIASLVGMTQAGVGQIIIKADRKSMLF